MPIVSDTELRSRLIRLAQSEPTLRSDILPILTASHDVEAGTYQEYLEKKKRQGKPPMKKDEWEARTNGGQQGGSTPAKKKDEKPKDEKKDEGKAKKEEPKKEKDSTPTPVDKKLGDLLSQWHSSGSDPVYAVSSNASGGKPVPKHVAEAALDKVTMLIENPEAHRISPADVKELTKAQKLLEKAVGGSKKEEPTDTKKEEPAKAKSYKKTYKPAVTKVMDKHNLTDDDAAQVKAFKKNKPNGGAPVSDAVLMQRFMAKAKPETKERMKGMSPKEFMAMLAAISDDEGGKTAALRANLIRLAHSNEALRPHLLPIITACSCETEAPMMGKYEEGKPADPTENMSEEDKKNWTLNTLQHKDQFKAAAKVTPLGKAEKGDTVEVSYKGETVQGKVVRVKKDGVVTVDVSGNHSDEDVGWIDVKIPKTASTAVVRKNIAITVRIRNQKQMPLKDGLAPFIQVTGQMSIDFGGDVQPDAVVFTSTISDTPKGFVIHSFDMVKSVSGGGAEILLGVLKDAFQEALNMRGRQLLTVQAPTPDI